MSSRLSLYDPWLDPATAAAATHKPLSTLTRAIEAGELRAAVMGGRTLIHSNWLRSWLLPQALAQDVKRAAAGDAEDAA